MKVPAMLLIICVVLLTVCSAKSDENKNKGDIEDGRKFIGQVLEQGRTLVHNTFKRFMILLPVIFFKLGIAFTMLLLVTIVSVNNGFIGFLLLVVGLSSVLARLQEARKPSVVPYVNPPVPYVNPVPVYHTKYIQDWDRKDKGIEGSATQAYSQIYGSQYGYPQLSGYYKQNSVIG